MKGWKSAQTGHRFLPRAVTDWWRRKKRAQQAQEASGRWRGRGHSLSQKLEGHLTAMGKRRSAPEAVASRRAGGESRRGIRGREWLAVLTERVLLWLLTGIVLLKNIVDFWIDVWLISREWLLRRLLYPPFAFDTFASEVQVGRLHAGSQSVARRREPGWQAEDTEPVVARAALPTVEGREEAERAKIFGLDVEEEELSDDELTDQAWALRTRLAASSREDLPR
ncbi:MAG: hypothetical protein HQM06_09550 [Magnetococcales bacterium]|nr:hypothetical protein [Magnetococcales bacterium]